MNDFVAVVRPGEGGVPELPGRCVTALDLPGVGVPSRYSTAGFACAAVQLAPAPGAIVVHADAVVTGDVRLDARDDLFASDVDVPHLPRGDARGAGDLALVAAAARAWGLDAPGRLRGDFSWVAWHPARRSLVAARDGMGVRPLYYARIPGGVVVSNLIDAVRAHPAVSSRLDDAAVVSFLRTGWNVNRVTTTFAAISRLAPGTAFALDAGAAMPRVFTHWRIPDPALERYADDGEYVERYRALLSRAVADRIEPDRTVIFLSGGIDSPTIAAAATRTTSASRLRAVTARVRDVESVDEARLAAAVAARLGIPHEVIETVTDAAPESAPATPEPQNDPEFVAFGVFLRRLPRDTRVVISGEDGDALFSPPSFAAMLKREPVGRVVRDVLGFTVRHGRHPYMGFWLRRRLRAWARAALRGTPPRAPVWLTPHACALAGPDELPLAHLVNRARPEGAAALTSSIWQSVHDNTSRAYHRAPLEYRWPMLDARLLEFVFSIPAIPWCQRKWLPRRAYRDDLPAEVIARPKTTIPGYYEPLVAGWRMRTNARVAPLHSETARFVDPRLLADVLRSGGDEDVLVAWRALQFDRWVTLAGAA